MRPLERISARVNRLGDINDPATPRPLLTLAEFFDGNEAIGSIGCNLSPTPHPDEFRRALEHIVARADVTDVRVQVTMFDDLRWPFSDLVWIVTSAEPDDVVAWFDEALRPDACFEGWPEDVPTERCPVPAGMHPVACWWD